MRLLLRLGGDQPVAARLQLGDLRAHRAQGDRLLQAPSVGRRRRRQQLEGAVRKVCEAGRVGDRPGARLGHRSPAAVEVGERSRDRQVRQGHLLREGLDVVQLFESLRRGRGVVIADLADPDDGHTVAGQPAQLAGGDRGRHEVGGARDAVDVRVQAPGPPCPLELEAVLLQGEEERGDHGVQLGGQPDRVEAKAGQRVMRLAFENGVEVVHHLHPAGVQRGGTGCASQHRHVGALPSCAHRRAVGRNAAPDDDDFHLAPRDDAAGVGDVALQLLDQVGGRVELDVGV